MTTETMRLFHIAPACAARARLEEAEHYFLVGNLNEALAAAQQAWREHPQEPDIFRALSYIHMARGEYPPAAQAAQQAVKLDDGNPLSYAGLAQVYLAFGVLNYAQDTLEQARAHFPEDATLLALSADLHFRQRRDMAALQDARAALQRNPQDAYAKSLLGTYYLRRWRYAEAAPLLDATVQAYPQRADYLRDLGIAHLHTEAYAAALHHLAQSFRLYDADPITQQHLHYALRATRGNAPGAGWRLSLAIYDRSVMGWTAHVLGWCCIVAGVSWGGSVAHAISGAGIDAAAAPAGLFVLGMALVVLTFSGLRVRHERGPRFADRLRRLLQERGLAEA